MVVDLSKGKRVVEQREYAVSDDSVLNAYNDFTPVTDADESYEIDQQQIYTGGIFRTSKGKDRAQIIADPRMGQNAFQLYLNNVLRASLVEDVLEFFDDSGTSIGVIYADSADDAFTVQSNAGFDLGIISGEDLFLEAVGEIQANAGTSVEVFINSVAAVGITSSFIDFLIGGVSTMAVFSGALLPAGDGVVDLGGSSNNWNEFFIETIQFKARNVTSLNAGEMAYHDNAGTQNFRVNAGGFFGSIDLTAV